MDNYRIAVLAGINQGAYAQREEQQNEEFSKKDKARKFSTDEKLSHRLKNGRTVLDTTLETLLECSNSVSVIGNPDFLRQHTSSSYTIVPQRGQSQLQSIEQAVVHLYQDGYQGKSLVICGDVPCITKEDIDIFYMETSKKKDDVIMGLADIDDLRELGVPNKRGIRAYDAAYEFNRTNPKLVYGNIFMITSSVYTQFDAIKNALNDALQMKKFFREPANYSKILEYLKDDEKTIATHPTTKMGLILGSLKYSTALRKLLFRNLLGQARSDKSVSVPEMSRIVQKKLFQDRITFSFGYASPRLAIDVDDEQDAEVANSILE
jgi:hypothetical protein